MHTLTPAAVHQTLRSFFPVRNDYSECEYVEELGELNDFRITTEDHLRALLQRRVDEVMEIDRSPMSDYDVKLWSEELGKDVVEKFVNEGYWFAYPGLLRVALELEFGKQYQDYADKRDGAAEPDAAPVRDATDNINPKSQSEAPADGGGR